jgi:phenylalanine-4-hydroxylase
MTAVRSDFAIEQNWQAYSEEEHAIWRLLFERQQRLLVGRACREYLDGLRGLGVAADGIPDFRGLSDILDRSTGWRIVAVPGLVPDDVFFAHLAHRRFPSTCFIRRRDQLDYIQEPDVFHDICGHVPLLMNPVFADYLQAYGEGGLKALGLGHLQRLARLYCRVWADSDGGRPAYLRVRDTVLGRRIGLLPRRRAAAPVAVRSAPDNADTLSDRRFPAALFRNQ